MDCEGLATLHGRALEVARASRRSDPECQIAGSAARPSRRAAIFAAAALAFLAVAACAAMPGRARVVLSGGGGGGGGGEVVGGGSGQRKVGSSIGSIEDQLQGAQQMFDDAQPVPSLPSGSLGAASVPTGVPAHGARGRNARRRPGDLGLGDMSQKEFMHKVDSGNSRNSVSSDLLFSTYTRKGH
jgi:hypothetical protein